MSSITVTGTFVVKLAIIELQKIVKKYYLRVSRTPSLQSRYGFHTPRYPFRRVPSRRTIEKYPLTRKHLYEMDLFKQWLAWAAADAFC